jgi:hypothetical protein
MTLKNQVAAQFVFNSGTAGKNCNFYFSRAARKPGTIAHGNNQGY